MPPGSTGYVSALERQRYSASLDMIETLAMALGVAPADLLVSNR